MGRGGVEGEEAGQAGQDAARLGFCAPKSQQSTAHFVRRDAAHVAQHISDARCTARPGDGTTVANPAPQALAACAMPRGHY